jgi:hypothetical protein
MDAGSALLARVRGARGSVCGSGGASAFRGCSPEVVVPADDRGVGRERQRAREVHRVVAAQPVLCGQLSSLVDECAVDADD